jgi:hypothetical protein
MMLFRLMRNIHLGLGLAFALIALLFALSSLAFIYGSLLPEESVEDAEQTLLIPAAKASNGRALASELMRNHGIEGDLRGVEVSSEEIRFRIVRPGTEAHVVYSPASEEATIRLRRLGLAQTLKQLHTNHGFWHDFLPSNVWAGLSLLGSIGLILLGLSGIYLWFNFHHERIVGGVLLGGGILYAVTTLVLTRMS